MAETTKASGSLLSQGLHLTEEEFAARLSGTLEGEHRRLVEGHLSECVECQRAIAAAQVALQSYENPAEIERLVGLIEAGAPALGADGSSATAAGGPTRHSVDRPSVPGIPNKVTAANDDAGSLALAAQGQRKRGRAAGSPDAVGKPRFTHMRFVSGDGRTFGVFVDDDGCLYLFVDQSDAPKGVRLTTNDGQRVDLLAGQVGQGFVRLVGPLDLVQLREEIAAADGEIDAVFLP